MAEGHQMSLTVIMFPSDGGPILLVLPDAADTYSFMKSCPALRLDNHARSPARLATITRAFTQPITLIVLEQASQIGGPGGA